MVPEPVEGLNEHYTHYFWDSPIFFKQENRMSGKKSKNAVHFFVDYVKERNVSLMTKAEWEKFYFTALQRTAD